MRLPLTAGQALCFLEQVGKLAASFSFLAAAAAEADRKIGSVVVRGVVTCSYWIVSSIEKILRI